MRHFHLATGRIKHSHLQPLAATCSHLQPLAATCSHLQPTASAAICLATTCNHLIQSLHVAANGCKWLVAASGRKCFPLSAPGCSWLPAAVCYCKIWNLARRKHNEAQMTPKPLRIASRWRFSLSICFSSLRLLVQRPKKSWFSGLFFSRT